MRPTAAAAWPCARGAGVPAARHRLERSWTLTVIHKNAPAAMPYAAKPVQNAAPIPPVSDTMTARTVAHTEVAPLIPHSHGVSLAEPRSAAFIPHTRIALAFPSVWLGRGSNSADFAPGVTLVHALPSKLRVIALFRLASLMGTEASNLGMEGLTRRSAEKTGL